MECGVLLRLFYVEMIVLILYCWKILKCFWRGLFTMTHSPLHISKFSIIPALRAVLGFRTVEFLRQGMSGAGHFLLWDDLVFLSQAVNEKKRKSKGFTLYLKYKVKARLKWIIIKLSAEYVRCLSSFSF